MTAGETPEAEGPQPRRGRRRRRHPRHGDWPDPPVPEGFPVTRCPPMHADGAGKGYTARPTGRVPNTS